MHRYCFILIACVLTSPAWAQTEATIVGTVTDQTKGILPGATITATELTTGRVVTAVSREGGEFQMPNVPPGTYRVQAELEGFTAAVVPRVELLVGQNANLTFVLTIGNIRETVMVKGDAPLVDVTSNRVSGNVDRRQMEELPLQGRNWMELSLMVKGVIANNVDQRPGVNTDTQFRLNLDGQEISQNISRSSFGQPKFSREAIAEFQIVTNLFDVSQGRSGGIQVQAITRSGTNTLAGSVFGYFRSDKLNSADHVAKRVLPYENQQVGFSLGGPIVANRTHYFGSYEYEREPNSVFVQPPQLPNQSWVFPNTDRHHSSIARIDHSMSAKDNFSFRWTLWDFYDPFELPAQSHPSQAQTRARHQTNLLLSWTRVWNSAMVSETKVGYNTFGWKNGVLPEMVDQPNLAFPGMAIGAVRTYPSQFDQSSPTIRTDVNWNRGRHQIRAGGEYLHWSVEGFWSTLKRGEFVFSSLPPDLERRFPQSQWNDPSAWDLTGLDSRVLRFDQNYAGYDGGWTLDVPRRQWALWLGDTWRVTDRLSLNYGIRWDDDLGAFDPPHVPADVPFAPWGSTPLYKLGLRDHDNVAPRAGFVYKVGGGEDLVIRGGSGLFYATTVTNISYTQQAFNTERIIAASFPNDRRSGFIQDPTRGLTAEDFTSGRVPLPIQAPQVISHEAEMPYSWQSSIGFQKQLGEALAIESDLTLLKEYNVPRGRDINLFFDPATGYNRNPATAGRPDPRYSEVLLIETAARANQYGLSTALTRRFKDNVQASLAYTLTFDKNDMSTYFTISADNQFDPDAEWAPAEDFQRHTLRGNVIYRMPAGFVLAAAYGYGSGSRFITSISGRPYNKPGTNRLNTGAPITIPDAVRARFDGPGVIGTNEVVPRNALIGKALHKFDLRISKEVRLARTLRLTGIAEVFNVFNHANYGDYNGQINSATFGQPRQTLGNAYMPRSGQLGVRLAF